MAAGITLQLADCGEIVRLINDVTNDDESA
jgi:hypothetical protein